MKMSINLICPISGKILTFIIYFESPVLELVYNDRKKLARPFDVFWKYAYLFTRIISAR